MRRYGFLWWGRAVLYLAADPGWTTLFILSLFPTGCWVQTAGRKGTLSPVRSLYKRGLVVPHMYDGYDGGKGGTFDSRRVCSSYDHRAYTHI